MNEDGRKYALVIIKSMKKWFANVSVTYMPRFNEFAGVVHFGANIV